MTIGQPIPIIKKGKFLVDTISKKKNKIDILSVSSQLHAQGIHSFQEIVYAQIEPNGQITAVREGSEMPSVIIMKDGKVRECSLSDIEKDARWLEDELKKVSVTCEDVFIAEFWNGRLTFILNDGEVKKSRP